MPSHYVSIMNVKSERLDTESQHYVQWVKTHYRVETDTLDGVPKLIRKGAAPPPAAHPAYRPNQEQPLHIRRHNAQAEVLAGLARGCNHENYHNKGSSMAYRQFECKDCGFRWQERRDAGVVKSDPSECLHRNTNHSGSTAKVLRTRCKDCDTYISTVSREVAEQEQQAADNLNRRVLNSDDEGRVDRMMDHSDVRQSILARAAELMVREIADLEPGLYNVAETCTMWIDCIDQALAQPSTSSKPTERVAHGSQTGYR